MGAGANGGRGRRGSWVIPLGLAVASASAFLPVLGYGFVDWDDQENFTENPDFGGLSRDHAAWAWTTFRLGVYQPLAWMLLEAQASLWGLDARGYHAVSLALHAANAVALFGLIVALLGRALPGGDRRGVAGASALAALLFAVHPLRAEVVAWASCQPYLPSALCAVLSARAYLHAHPEGGPTRPGWVAVAWLGFAAAVLFKAVAASLPAVLLILDVYPLRRLGPGRRLDRRVWAEKVAFAAVGAAALGVAVRAKAGDGALASFGQFGVEARAALASYGVAFYLVKTVWPTGLTCFYGTPGRVSLLAPPFGPSALAAAGATALAVLRARRWPGFSAAWFAYLAVLAPNLGLVRVGHLIAADRYSYLASIPWAVLTAYALLRLGGGRPARRAGVAVAALALAAGLGVLTWRQCQTWRSSEALLDRAVALDPGAAASPALRVNLGASAFRRGRLIESADRYQDALRLDPSYPAAHYNLGAVRLRQGRLDEAARHFAEAARLAPDDPRAHFNLAAVRLRQGRLDEAASEYAEVVRLRPDDFQTFSYLAALAEKRGRADEVIAHYTRASRLRPDDAPTHNNLGIALAGQGKSAEAEAEFAAALRLNPDYPQARYNLDRLRRRTGRGPGRPGPRDDDRPVVLPSPAR